MIGHLVALGAGVVFAIGLGLSGMTDPAKVQNFLDFAGAWDASLAFVMVGAIGVYAIASRLVLRRARPIYDGTFYVPTGTIIDAPLVVGAALFGVGWGLAGFCPGPAIVSLASGHAQVYVFVGCMLLGMLLRRATVSAPPAVVLATREADA